MPFTEAQELAILDMLFGGGSLDATTSELDVLHEVTAGTPEAGKALVLGGSWARTSHIAGLAATVAKTDIDDDGTIDGTEVAAALQAIHGKINAILVVLETLGIVASS